MKASATSSAVKQAPSVPSRHASTVVTKPASLPPIVIVTGSVPAVSPPSWELRTLLVVAPAQAANAKLAVPCWAAHNAGYDSEERWQLVERS